MYDDQQMKDMNDYGQNHNTPENVNCRTGCQLGQCDSGRADITVVDEWLRLLSNSRPHRESMSTIIIVKFHCYRKSSSSINL